ncbi:hypothetical protein CVU76_01750 [Candidatus Dojkabacteria bacterium HGW-Dojkabacteria-1]|uniref:TIGR00374 family protein n=1 Tax=Candidatus Dojkabacteria bacterium HGW-Dojkabacteria-1 TaxID=2013761 RepID=A0A2N2F3F5_9BACT|nr:MAG: hypothetical protein CVU76_01750 [Candidatus Dojkabacteria bacterium HGW-Dojkabacteria-1]
MKMFSKNSISTLLTVIVLILFGIYLYNNQQILSVLLQINPIYIALIMGIFLLVFLLEGIFIKVTLNVFDKKIDLKEAYYLSTISRIGNYLLPMRAGAIFRATYLKNKYQFEYSKFLSTLYAYYILLFLINAFFALLSLISKYINTGNTYPLVTIFFVFLFIITLGVILFRKTINLKNIKGNKYIEKVLTILNKFMNSWDMIVRKEKLFLSLIFITTGNILLNGIINYIEFIGLGIKATILDILLYTCLSGVSLLISITPGSLGLREAVFFVTSESIGITNEQVMQLAFLDRGIMFFLLLGLLILISLFVKKFKLKDIFFVKESNK